MFEKVCTTSALDISEELLNPSEVVTREQPAHAIRDIPHAPGAAHKHAGSYLRRHGRRHLLGDGLMTLTQRPRRLESAGLQVPERDLFSGERAPCMLSNC